MSFWVIAFWVTASLGYVSLGNVLAPLRGVGWMSVRQLIEFYTVLQTHKTLISGLPRPLYASLQSDYPYRTRNATIGNIRFGRNIVPNTFRYRAMISYNAVPGEIKTGSV